MNIQGKEKSIVSRALLTRFCCRCFHSDAGEVDTDSKASLHVNFDVADIIKLPSFFTTMICA